MKGQGEGGHGLKGLHRHRDSEVGAGENVGQPGRKKYGGRVHVIERDERDGDGKEYANVTEGAGNVPARERPSGRLLTDSNTGCQVLALMKRARKPITRSTQ